MNNPKRKENRFYLKLKTLFYWYMENYNIFYYLFKYKKPGYISCDYNDYWKKRAEKEFHFSGEREFVEGPGVNAGKLEQKILLGLSVKYRRARILSSIIGAGSTVLDIGCGRGEVLKYLKKHNGIKGSGIDVSSHVVEILRRGGVEAVCCDMNNDCAVRSIRGKYDYILLISVIEHLSKPENLLKAIKDKINKALIIGIPNSGFYQERFRLLFGKFPMQWTEHPADHLRFWTLRDFKWWVKWMGGYRIKKVTPDWGTPVLKDLFPSMFTRSFFFILEPRTVGDNSA